MTTYQQTAKALVRRSLFASTNDDDTTCTACGHRQLPPYMFPHAQLNNGKRGYWCSVACYWALIISGQLNRTTPVRGERE